MGFAHSSPDDFVCAICQRTICMRWERRRGPDQIIPPLCRSCEQDYARGVGKPDGGTLRDRREATRILALAEALHSAAAQRLWGRING